MPVVLRKPLGLLALIAIGQGGILLFALGGAQAFIGKIMVASGQVDAPQVSHFKLTAHLGAAFLVYALMLWTALNLLFKPTGSRNHPACRVTVALTVLI